jgi:hypothetical protein
MLMRMLAPHGWETGIAMNCPACGREQPVAALLCAECWLPLQAQTACVADTHFWHVREDDGWYMVFCSFCQRAAGLVPSPRRSPQAV